MEKLFKTAMDYINKYSLNIYAANVYPDVELRKRIKLQGDIEKNKKALKMLDFKFEEENGWYVYAEGDIEITITQ